MILRRMVLKNYRKFRTLEVEFPAGLLGVVGRNGAGKTTLLEAVAFALYGTQASRTKAKGIRRDGAAESEVCEVEIELSVGGDPHRVVRRLKGINETQQAELYRRGGSEPVATQAVGVTAAVRTLLGMDYSTFTRSVYSKQKEVNALSDASPEERRGAIRRMVGIEIVTKARDAARLERRQKEAEVEGARRAIEDLPVKKAELKEVKESSKAAQLAAKETGRAAVEAAKMVRVTLAELNRQETKRTKQGTLEKVKSGLSGDLRGAVKREENLRKESASLADAKVELAKLLPEDRAFVRVRDTKEMLDKASGKHEERVELEREVEVLRKDLERAKSELASARQSMSTFVRVAPAERAARSEERKARAAVTRLQKARGNAQRKVGSAESQRRKAEKALADVRRLGRGGRCPTCYRALGDSFEDIMAHLVAERDRLVAESKAVNANIRVVDAQIRAAEGGVQDAVRGVQTVATKAKAAARAKERLAAARENHDRARRTLREKHLRLRTLRKVKYDAGRHRELVDDHRRLAGVHDRVEALKQDVSRVPQVKKRHGECIREIRALRKQIATVERREAAVKFVHAEYVSAKTTCTDAQASDKSAALAHSRSRGEVDTLKETLRRLAGDLSRLERLRTAIIRDEETIRYVVRIEGLLDAFRLDLINRVRPQIEEHASVLLDQVTTGRYPRIALDEDYNISIHDGTQAYPISRFSGGEEDLANLCLRLAISQVVAQRSGGDISSLVVLDEVFGSQDAERRERVLQALTRLQETFQQIFLITHMEDIHDRVPNALQVSDNRSGEAEAAWI